MAASRVPSADTPEVWQTPNFYRAWYYYGVSIFENAVDPGIGAVTAQGRVRVRDMARGDLRQVARLHRQHFPDGYYARLGERFLVAHYRGFLESPHAVAFVVDHDEEVQAFLVGTVDEVGHRRYLAQHRQLQLVTAGTVALGARPALWWDFVRVRSHWYARRALSRFREGTSTGLDHGTFGELAYVITRPPARNRGIGAHLVESYLAATRTSGASHAFLVTRAGNTVARPFYEKRGWMADGQRRTRDGAALAAYRFGL